MLSVAKFSWLGQSLLSPVHHRASMRWHSDGTCGSGELILLHWPPSSPPTCLGPLLEALSLSSCVCLGTLPALNICKGK
jgi:hypothetical protein